MNTRGSYGKYGAAVWNREVGYPWKHTLIGMCVKPIAAPHIHIA
nr:MAG TPA: hypothetical protein [Caudoviricetes sp.]